MEVGGRHMPSITTKNQFVNYLLLLVSILVILNIVARTLFVRVDLTDRKMYSLSESSRDVIGKLEDRLVAKVFFSSDIPGTYANQKRYLQDILEEYQAYSGGRFRFEFISPDKDEKLQKQAQEYNIPPVQMQAIENDKMEVRNVYMGLVFLYNDKKETIPVLQTTQGLEYNLTATVKKITAASLKSVGMVSVENEEVSVQGLRQFLEQIYSIQTVTLATPVPSNIMTLVMNGVRDSLKAEELFHLDQFLMRGGRLFLAQGRIHDMWQQGFAMDIRSNIFTFLEHYGIGIGHELLIDNACTQIQVQSQQGPFLVRNAIDYPPFPMIQRFNTTHALTRDLTVARLFFVSEVTPVQPGGLSFEPLMYTSDKTGALQGPFYQISPMQNPMMKVFPFSSKVVAGIVEGTASSFFKDSAVFAARSGFIGTTSDLHMVIVTDNQFFNDKRAGGIPENATFILNTVDYLCGDEELITIRAKDVTQRPLAELSDGARQSIKWINVALPAFLIVGFGLVRWRINRNRRKVLEEIYG